MTWGYVCLIFWLVVLGLSSVIAMGKWLIDSYAENARLEKTNQKLLHYMRHIAPMTGPIAGFGCGTCNEIEDLYGAIGDD